MSVAHLTQEHDLITQTLDGKSEAFAELVRRHQDRLFSALLAVTGNHHEAEELTQDAFVQAYVKLPQFRRQSAFYTWLYRIAFNRMIGAQRKKRPVSLDGMGDRNCYEPQGTEESGATALSRSESQLAVQHALTCLSEEHRTIIVLREMEELDYEAIAQVLEIAVGTVRSRLFRARQELRIALESFMQE